MTDKKPWKSFERVDMKMYEDKAENSKRQQRIFCCLFKWFR
ncbi:MAG: hypothetical protein ACLRXQ_11015 [Phascolarctobacterium faecium]